MNALPVHLSAPRYVLGEHPADHTSIANLTARAQELRMPPKAALWGWGTVHRTAEDLETLAVRSGRATLAAAGTGPEQVDALVLCSTRFPGGPHTHGGFVRTVMTGLGLGDAAFTGITLNRCTNLLTGIRTAQAMVAAGQYRTVLVVTTDRVTDEAERMENFALFSDGSAACLVSDRPHGDDRYEILGGAAAQDPPSLDWSHEISSDLARVVNDRTLTPLGLTPGDLDGVLHPNLFKPVVVLKERQAGFTAAQLYLDNIPRVGHCFAADPLINLVDRAGAGQLRDGGHYLLASSVPGVRVGVLLRKPPAAPPESDETTESR
ncbi:3-oxoacyl-ACP synthase [Streptomyces sp. OfavH-34-F]|uniref:3-oxoacyl-ACP synthase n=1 Tax=Streptomyces sp. OfavH-34-F TaxID=2917760 RepID=UPI001EF3204F|nr:3-oxoacyl-ACP synthase [Streptomyces sp. OfavH-34-F]MCG7523700.1 3-oxoacyl-ACP synthase [Streptomyces sp. OfavH-34-F]